MKHKPLLSEVRKMQKIAGLIKENTFVKEDVSYPSPNLDITKTDMDENDWQDFVEEYLEPYEQMPAKLKNAEDIMNVKEILGKNLPVVFTFILMGDYSDRDQVYDLGNGQYLYVYGYDGGIVGLLSKEGLSRLVNDAKAEGAEPFKETTGMSEEETLEPEAGVSDEEEIDLDGDTDNDSWNKPDPDDTDEFEKEPTTRDIKGTKDLTGVLKYQADLKDLVNMKDTILSKYKAGEIGLDQYKQQIGNVPQMIKKLRAQIEKAMNVTVDDEDETGM